MDRHEQTDATRIDSGDKHTVADLGDLTQLSRGQERAMEDPTVHTMEAVGKAVSDFADRVNKLGHTPEFRALIANIDYMAEKGEPLYMLIKQALKQSSH